jgi:DNA-binding transcriptional LysR family regulator
LGSGRQRDAEAMELMQLEMFVAIVEERSVRGAADRVFRTQPAVSIAMRKLEEEISAPLFDRSKRYEYRLTQVGEALYSYATRLLHLRNEAVSAVADLSRRRTERLCVGANESISIHLLPKLTHAFLKLHSGIRIEFRWGSSAHLVAELKERRVDLTILSFMPDDTQLESQIILRDELVLITSPKDIFARRGSVRMADLHDRATILMDVSSDWHKKMMDAFIQAKVSVNAIIENAPVETIKRMVVMGLGVGFVPHMCVTEEEARGQLAVVAIEGFHLECSLYLVRRRALHCQAVKEFTQVAVSYGEVVHRKTGLTMQDGLTVLSSDTEKRGKVLVVKRRA